jgi:hypothetical protein
VGLVLLLGYQTKSSMRKRRENKKTPASSSFHNDTAEATSLPATSSTSLALCASLSQMFLAILFWNLLLLSHSVPTSISHWQLAVSDATFSTFTPKAPARTAQIHTRLSTTDDSLSKRPNTNKGHGEITSGEEKIVPGSSRRRECCGASRRRECPGCPLCRIV